MELAAREPDTTLPRLRTPDLNGSQGPGRRTPLPTTRQRLSGPNLSDQARRPTHTTLDRLPDHAGLPVPHRSRAAGRVTNPRAGDHRTSLPGGTPADRATHDRPGGEAAPPKQGRMTAPAPPQDSRRLGREPKTNLKSLDPELDQRSTTDSIHRSLNTTH